MFLTSENHVNKPFCFITGFFLQVNRTYLPRLYLLVCPKQTVFVTYISLLMSENKYSVTNVIQRHTGGRSCYRCSFVKVMDMKVRIQKLCIFIYLEYLEGSTDSRKITVI